jgi:hypothetical protein
VFGGKTTIHLGGKGENFVLLPIIPPKAQAKAKRGKPAARERRRR